MTMTMLIQGALMGACLAVALYCHILARRLRRLNDLETGLGGAIAVMSAEVARLETAIVAARGAAEGAGRALAAEVQRAEDARLRLRLDHDFSDLPDAPRPRRIRRRSPGAMEGYDA